MKSGGILISRDIEFMLAEVRSGCWNGDMASMVTTVCWKLAVLKRRIYEMLCRENATVGAPGWTAMLAIEMSDTE